MKSSIPFMSVRGVTLFPGNAIGLEIGRDFTIASLRRARQYNDGKIIVAAQRMVELEGKPDIQQIFDVGCLCKVTEFLEFPDGHVRIRVLPVERFKIESLQEIEDARYCTGESLPEFASSEKISNEKKQCIQHSLENIFSETKSEPLTLSLEALKSKHRSYDFIMGVGYILATTKLSKKELTLEQMNQGIFLVDTYSQTEKDSIDMGVARIQEILSAETPQIAVRKIEALLA